MTITAKFSSICPTCKKRIAAGSRVEWSRGEKARHVGCQAPKEQKIEPKKGATYGPSAEAPFAVYEYDVWPRGSVLAGQTRRSFIDHGQLEDLKAKYPQAEVINFSLYQEPNLSHLPEEEDAY